MTTERDIWLMVARKVFAPSGRQPCFVCGKFESIIQAHHVVPLTTQYDRGYKVPDNEHVWLCPNHHTMAHLYILNDDRSMTERAMKSRASTTAALNSDLSDHEFERMMELMHLAGGSRNAN
jgi:predicted HNH restriction endonuclease